MTSHPARDPRYDILFEPVRIGPKTARNRFYQVPHCNGMGHRDPTNLAGMRGMKAAGGWAVVCTEETEIHPSSEVSPAQEGRLWGDEDIRQHLRVVEAIHAHGSLAGCQLVYNAPRTNLVSRMVPMGVSAGPVLSEWMEPLQARVMDKADIADVRRWHRKAAIRARDAGYDLVYVYGGHGLTLIQTFLSRATNDRGDEYGGSITNRMRLLRELIEEVKDAVGDTCAVPVRIAVEEARPDGLTLAEMQEVVGTLGELPDLWDFCMGSWPRDSQTARFADEGFQEDYIRGLKQLTTKPVVGVGRFTSPDAMVSQIRRGVLDLIGAARPSISDPFLPKKIEEGRIDDIRECIGCNICVAADNQSVQIRCTQNPTMGEEWRRGWHPEVIPAKGSDSRVLVVGAGPAGLEAAHQLGKRGYEVILAEATGILGGRARAEASLPGLASWARVADYRITQIDKLRNVEVYRGSDLNEQDILDFGAQHVALATGAEWARDGWGRSHLHGLPIAEGTEVLTPAEVMAGARPTGPVVVYDDDHYAIGGAVAEALAQGGAEVTLVTPAPLVSNWTRNTLEQGAIEARLVRAGIRIVTRGLATGIGPEGLDLVSNLTGAASRIAGRVVLVGARRQRDGLLHGLRARQAEWADAGILSVAAIGDALAPGMLVHAVFAGHLYARDLDRVVDPDLVPFRRDLPQ